MEKESQIEQKINEMIEDGTFNKNEFQEYELLISEGC